MPDAVTCERLFYSSRAVLENVRADFLLPAVPALQRSVSRQFWLTSRFISIPYARGKIPGKGKPRSFQNTGIPTTRSVPNVAA